MHSGPKGRRYVSLFLSLILTAMLCVTGYWGVTKTLEVRERSAAMTQQMRSHREFSETRIHLYEAALSATPDQSAFEKLNEAFRAYQAAKRTLQIRDQTAVHIVSVPEIRTVERSMEWSQTAKGEIFEKTSVLFTDSPDAMLGEVDGEYDGTYTKGESVQLWLQKVQK